MRNLENNRGFGRQAPATRPTLIRNAFIPVSVRHAPGVLAGATAGTLLVAGLVGISPAAAAQTAPGLGTARGFAVLAGEAVTNTGDSRLYGNLGVSPGTAVTGFPPGEVFNGVEHSADAVAADAKADLVTAYNSAAGASPETAVPPDIGNQTLLAGVYAHGTGLGITGTLTLDAKNDPAAVFIFKAGSTLTTASGSRVNLINGAQPCNVFWQVGSSATLGTRTSFVGTVMALASVSVKTGATVSGRILAREGQVSLDDNVIRLPGCDLSWTPPAESTPDDDTVPGETVPGETVPGDTAPETTPDGTTPGDTTSGGGTSGGGDTTSGGGESTSGGGSGSPVITTSRGRITVGNGTPDAPDETTPAVPRTPSTTSSLPGEPRIPVGHPRTGLGGAS